MTLRVIAIGKKHEAWVVEGIERYEKRLHQPFSIEWILLPHSRFDGLKARQEESEAIRKRLPAHAYTILLDERGKLYDSPTLAASLQAQFNASKDVYLIIGGAYGVDEALQTQASVLWSLSPLVFPHQLVRLMLVEQLYRAQEIARGGSYHHL